MRCKCTIYEKNQSKVSELPVSNLHHVFAYPGSHEGKIIHIHYRYHLVYKFNFFKTFEERVPFGFA